MSQEKLGTRLRRTFIGDRAFYSTMIAIVVPIIIQNTVSNVVSLLDNVMVGRVGTLEMSAVAIVNQLLFIFNLCIFGGLAGAGIFATQFAGAKDDEGVRHCFRIKWLIAIMMLAFALSVFLLLPEQLIGLYLAEGTDPTDMARTMGFGRDYLLVMLLGLILFCVGVLFAYKLMMPFMLRFLSTGIEGAEYIQTTTSIESYVNLCLTMFIIFGCVFEMPLITIILSKMGIINPQILKQVRGVAIVVIFFIAAVVTPPDIVSQCMVAGPMVLLYFVSILLSGIFYKPRDTDEDDEDEEEEEAESKD